MNVNCRLFTNETAVIGMFLLCC